MPEHHQSVQDVAEDLIEHIGNGYDETGFWVLRYVVDPDRVITFRVNWQDDQNRGRHNRGYRVQLSKALGPNPGGLQLDTDPGL